MTDDQVRDVRTLTRAAGINPTTTRIDGASHPMLAQLAPGKRTTVPGGLVMVEPAEAPANAGGGRGRGRRPSSAPTKGAGGALGGQRSRTSGTRGGAAER